MLEAAAAIAARIGDAIEQFNSAELCQVNVSADARTMWTTVQQLTGWSKAANSVSSNATITSSSLNDHYAAISDDISYTSVKSTVNHTTEWRLFKMLDTLPPTATGLDNIPAKFLWIGAPFYSTSISDIWTCHCHHLQCRYSGRQPQSVTWWTCHCHHSQCRYSGRQSQFCQFLRDQHHSPLLLQNHLQYASILQILENVVVTDFQRWGRTSLALDSTTKLVFSKAFDSAVLESAFNNFRQHP